MRVAALFDIHGNLPALEAVLDEVERAGVDVIVLGGDMTAGPMTPETLERLMALGERALGVRGNCERDLVAAFDGRELAGLPEAYHDSRRRETARLTQKQRDWLTALPLTLALEIDGLGPTLFCHATPRGEDELFTVLSPDERVLLMLAGVRERVVVCGHTHMPFDRRIGPYRVVNPGSVGSSYGTPGACWALLGPEARLVSTAYDVRAAAERLRRSGNPEAEEFVQRYVLQTYPADEALRVFEEASARAAAKV
jgi:predicted phosphodiesterase